MSKQLPSQLQDNIQSVRLMTITMAVCGAIALIGLPWALFYIILAFRLKPKKLPNRNLLNAAILITVPIFWCIAPVFLMGGLSRLRKNMRVYEDEGSEGLKPNKIWSGYRAAKRYGAFTGMLLSLVVIVTLIFPIPHSATITENVPYSTKYTESPSLELGEEKTEQVGITGKGTRKISTVTPVYAYLFRLNNTHYSKIESDSHTTKGPKNMIIAKGTKKYRYMWCSEGSYRYYTDEQFKNPDTGFTHKSADYCAKNNQGAMTQLADVPPRGAASSSSMAANSYSSQTNIDYTPQPVDAFIPDGSGADGAKNRAAEQQRLETEKNQREDGARQAALLAQSNTYRSCIAQLNASGAGGGSEAQYWCPRVAQEAYNTTYNNYIANHPLY